ncbi:MAG TPA: MarR family transcriptional regulator [Verrucomicrobiae bacterium]|nr:MarR family transcriptional regulator [Verrucomicrobiae bacterium]
MNTLTPVQQKFILHWGEMGTRWGINRTVAQMHALLFLSPGPLNAEQLAALLGVARSNVSTSLRELQNWGLIKVVHLLGDRRDHFECVTRDVWDMFRQVLDERKKREIDPTLELLKACVAEAEAAGPAEKLTRDRLADMRDFFEVSSGWYRQISRLPTAGLIKFMKAGEKLRKFLGLGIE